MHAAVVVTKMEHHAGRGDVMCCPHPHTNEKIFYTSLFYFNRTVKYS